jgi:phage-related protein
VYNFGAADRPLTWVGASLTAVHAFPPEARREAGYQLRRVQKGLMPNDWKPMPSVGPGVTEIRIHGRLEHRVLYIGKFEEAIYVLHAFEKKSRRTRKTDLDLARSRLKDVAALRRGTKER